MKNLSNNLIKKSKNKIIKNKRFRESLNRVECLVASKDCKKCGESSEYARTYGCPVGFQNCPHDTKVKPPGPPNPPRAKWQRQDGLLGHP